MTIYILPEEQIVGNRSSKLLASILPIERGEMNKVLKMELNHLKLREVKPFHISASEEEQLFGQIFPYWEGKTFREQKVKIWQHYGLFWPYNWGVRSWIRRYRQFGKEWVKRFYQFLLKGRIWHIKEAQAVLAANNPNMVNNIFDMQGHLAMGHKNIVEWGFGGLRALAKGRLEEMQKNLNLDKKDTLRHTAPQVPPDYEHMVHKFQERFSREKITPDNVAFLESVIITIDAAIKYIQRFGEFAKTESQKEGDPARNKELERISDICMWIATNQPRNFREAIQLVWFNHVIGIISYGMPGMLSVGRVDQYLFPFYERDRQQGVITDEEVRELCEDLLIKLSYNLLILPSYGKATGSEIGGDGAAITLGGVAKDGKDAVNALSYLFLEATENIKSMTNSMSFRIAPAVNPKAWTERIVEIFTKTSGPAVFNDDVVIAALQKTGVSLEDARDYVLIGCVEPTSQGNTFGTTSGNDISLVGLLEMVLTNGAIRNVGRDHGVKTGDPRAFASYEQVWEAYQKQMQFLVDHIAKCVNVKDYIYGTEFPNPFISATLDGCIEHGLDMTQGGAKYNNSSIAGRGLATTANSLYAIKQAVFDKQQMSMDDLIALLDRNFAREEKTRIELAKKVPKFGNDDDAVDGIAQQLATTFCEMVLKHRCIRGGTFRPGFFSYGMNVVDGFFLGATPDGRKAGEPVSNSISPANATENRGPTAVLKSVAKIDATQVANGLSLNMRLSPTMLDNPEKRSKVGELLAAYMTLGGMHVQFNVVRQEDLLDAQLHPEAHLGLIVRVSGYCAYFVDLGKPVQDDIIGRYAFNDASLVKKT